MIGGLGHIFARVPVIFQDDDVVPANAYITEDATDFYVTEDGNTYYVEET